MSKFLIYLSAIAILSISLAICLHRVAALESGRGANQAQPLAGLDQIIKQVGGVKVDSVTDSKLIANVTNTLNDMAANLRKMFTENKRLASQVQDVLQRVQNVTGINANATIKSIQQQASNNNISASLSNLSSLMPRSN